MNDDSLSDRLPRGLTPRLLTVDQAAAYCGVGRGNFEARVGVPPVKVFGNRVLYDRVALDRWLDSVSGLPRLLETEDVDWSRL